MVGAGAEFFSEFYLSFFEFFLSLHFWAEFFLSL